MHLFCTLLLALFIFSHTLYADIQILKQENKDSNTTLLVVAGIHGDEPGSYFAASLLASHYTIHSKNLWVVPNLNQKSIQNNKRALYGDMNRKFADIEKNDKDIKTIKKMKELILSKKVSLVLNLHDGHGFYRKDFQGKIFNPNAWGQTCVIDQQQLRENQAFGNLNQIALRVKNNVNTQLLEKHHAFDVRNTKTKYEDEQMQLSLTYFAVTNNKPAFAIESSKDLTSLAQKVYYQLLAIEEFMKIMKISYTKDFVLKEKSIQKILQNYGSMRINNNILLHLSNIKKSLSYIPIKSKNNDFVFSHPLASVKRFANTYIVYLGNKKVTELRAQYFKESHACPSEIEVEIDSLLTTLDATQEFSVHKHFKVIPSHAIRVNVIGFTAKDIDNESGMRIHKNSLGTKFAIDTNTSRYRIEFYKNDTFCSMSVVHFK